MRRGQETTGPCFPECRRGKADVLCTLDRDFYEREVVGFCLERDVPILNDVDLLHKLKWICVLSTPQIARSTALHAQFRTAGSLAMPLAHRQSPIHNNC